MTALKPSDFAEFFRAVYGYDPFPWQSRLAARVCGMAEASDKDGKDGVVDWPRCVALPTAAGKTACIDIAIFALACQASLAPEKRTAPRRIFFVVDRRVVVDQAYDHAETLAEKLKTADADNGILQRVADALRDVGADENRPLDVYPLRGGMYRESAWIRSPLQPTVITSTVDQVGSRLLFRGYGVSDASKPLHAALVGNDSLILLDEAHCARPFDQTMSLVNKYRGKDWAKEPLSLPFCFVTMTATPSAGTPENEIERLGEDDRKHAVLGERIAATKPARLEVSKAKGDKWEKWGPTFAKDLADHATSLHKRGFLRVGVIVNRVATAREVAVELRKKVGSTANVILLTGRMRPVDRDAIMKKIEPLLSSSKTPLATPIFVVATQTIEVGADLDFHALVTECASLDALRQRFGRLNRVAARDKAEAVIVVREDQTKPVDEEAKADPVYGNSLAKTWQWLLKHAEDRPVDQSASAEGAHVRPGKSKGKRGKKSTTASAPPSTEKIIDFGVAALDALLNDPKTRPDDPAALNAPSPDAAVLLPAHLDMWCQTSPRPVPDPDPSYFLHGPRRGEPEVQVVFRADLGDDADKWAEIVSLCPPSSSEALSVRLRDFTRWLEGEGTDETSSDVEGQRVEYPLDADDENDDSTPARRRALRWRGPDARDTSVVGGGERATPNDLFVVPITTDEQRAAAATLGDFPINDDGTPRITDAGDEAFQRSRDKAILRLLQTLYPELNGAGDATDFSLLDDEEAEGRVEEALKALSAHSMPHVQRAAKALGVKRNRVVELHPLGGLVLIGKRRLHLFDPTFIEPEESWEAASDRPYPLADHCRDVGSVAGTNARRSGVNEAHAAITLAGELHDAGKADPRFQAWLHGGNARRAAACATLYAKSVVPVRSCSELMAFRDRAGYPAGARHELASVRLAECDGALPADFDATQRDLVLHLIAAHHGYCRPFAPVIEDPRPQEVAFDHNGHTLHTSSATALERLDSGVAERFWTLTRRYGWWGLPYLEALLRLADWACSEPREAATPANASSDGRTSAVSAALPEAVS